MITYTVRCTFTDAKVAEEWIAWLRGGHMREVMEGGAIWAGVIRFDGTAGSGKPGEVTCEARYVFESRDVLAVYERDHAPRLRAEGIKRFPPERGITYERRVGEVWEA